MCSWARIYNRKSVISDWPHKLPPTMAYCVRHAAQPTISHPKSCAIYRIRMRWMFGVLVSWCTFCWSDTRRSQAIRWMNWCKISICASMKFRPPFRQKRPLWFTSVCVRIHWNDQRPSNAQNWSSFTISLFRNRCRSIRCWSNRSRRTSHSIMVCVFKLFFSASKRIIGIVVTSFADEHYENFLNPGQRIRTTINSMFAPCQDRNLIDLRNLCETLQNVTNRKVLYRRHEFSVELQFYYCFFCSIHRLATGMWRILRKTIRLLRPNCGWRSGFTSHKSAPHLVGNWLMIRWAFCSRTKRNSEKDMRPCEYTPLQLSELRILHSN